VEIANCETYGLLAVVLLLLVRQYPVKNPTNGYLEQRQVKYTHCELRKLARFDATCMEFAGVRALPQFQRNTTKMGPACAAVSGFTFLFHPIG